jgi:hypothetical protein
LIEVPNPAVFAKYQTVGIEVLYSKTDIVEGLESESDLHDSSIQRQGFDGVALDEKAVADMLKVSEHLCLISTP